MAGSDADLVIWDPRKTRTISSKTHHHATDNNIFEGMTCFGVPEYVISKGRVCVDECQVKVLQGFGNFTPTPAFPTCVYDLVRDSDQVRDFILWNVTLLSFQCEGIRRLTGIILFYCE